MDSDELQTLGLHYGLSPAQLTDIRSQFELFDINQDGHISVTEIATVLENLGYPTQTHQEAEKLMTIVDRDKNGLIEFEEFCHYLTKKMYQDADDVELREAFKLFDADDDGYIAANDIRTIMTSMGDTLDDAEVDEMLKLVRVNEQGKISFEDFRNMECWRIQPPSEIQQGAGMSTAQPAAAPTGAPAPKLAGQSTSTFSNFDRF